LASKAAPKDARAALRLPADVKERMEADAAEAGRSLNSFLLWLYEDWVRAGRPAKIKGDK
jgi:predicted HicB family RNase H-like nuclease